MVGMDLLDEESHRLLLWAVRLDEVGGAPTRKQLLRLAEPRRPVAMAITAALNGRDVEYAEGAISSLLRRGLLERISDRALAPTRLGREVISAVGLHPEEMPMFEVLDADLQSSDPLAFARVVGRIASLDRPMVIDPYCRRAQLEYLVAHTAVRRVLVSDRLTDSELDDLSDYVATIRNRPTKLRVRVASAGDIHDRHVVSADRVLQVGGTAHSSAAGTTVLAEPVDLSATVRDYYRRIWKQSAKLVTYKPRGNAGGRVA